MASDFYSDLVDEKPKSLYADIFDSGGEESPENAAALLPEAEKLSDAAAMMKEGAADSLHATRRAQLADSFAKTLDIPGMFKALINQPNRLIGQPDMPPIISPETGAKVAKFFSPVESSEGSLAQGIEKGAGQLLSGLTEPENLAAMVLAKRFPMPVARAFQGDMIGQIPESTKQLMQAKTPAEAGQAGVGLAANIAFPAGIEKGINASEIKTPTEVGRDVRTQPVEGERQVPVEESKPGVQPQTEAGIQPPKEILKLPEVKEGMVRLYTGAGQTGTWYSQDINRAATFGPDVSYVDVPTDVAEIAQERARNLGSGTKGDHALPGEWTKQAKPVGKIEPPIHELDAPEPLKPDMASARKVADMTPQEFLEQAKSFNNVNLDLGRNATEADVSELTKLRDKANKRVDDAMKAVDDAKTPEAKERAMQDLGKLSTMPQFFNEAIAEAGKSHPKALPVAKYAGKIYGLDQWSFKDPATGRTRHVSADTARKAGYDPEPVPSVTPPVTEPPKPAPAAETPKGVDSFIESMNPMNAKKARNALDESVLSGGRPTTRKEIIEKSIADGAVVESTQSPDTSKINKLTEYLKRHRDRPFGNENHPETIAYNKAKAELEAGPVKTERRLIKPNGAFRGEAQITKTGMDYAEHLLSNKPKETSAVPPQAETHADESRSGTVSASPALGITPFPGAQAAVQSIGQKLVSLRNKLANSWASRGVKADIARAKDAADNQAKIFANAQGRSVNLEAKRIFGDQSAEALRAVVPVIEAGGNRRTVATFIQQSTGKHFEAMKAAEFAMKNWDALQPLAAKIKALHDAQIAEENANGIPTEYRDNYIKHAFDVDKLPSRGAEFFGSSGSGAKSGFKAARKFETVYDAIEAGYGKALKSLNSAKLVESRLAAGQQLINDRQWVQSFRGVSDPTTGKPIVDTVTFDKNHYPIAPAGYDAVAVLPGQFVAVHNGYRGIFDAVTGTSKIAGGEIAGLPVGQAVMGTAAGIKHGLLLFDTFHASRIMQKQFFLTGKVGYGKGLSMLEYNTADLAEAVRQGEITPEMANYARANRPKMDLLLKEGLNVGRIQEALRSEIVRNIPVIGPFNKWVFDKVTRGAMMESALTEFDRVSANNPAMTPQQVAAMVSKKINVTFGNIGRQGLFKSKTMQDLARLVSLAPQWVEAMARSEVGGFAELGKVPVDAAIGQGLKVGTLGKTMAGGLLAYVVGTQLLNLATRGHPTWNNPEEGHKLDAWIPDITGKTPGYFLNPLSVVAELTHDAYRYAFKKDNAIDIGVQIAQNKANPMARAAGVLWSGKNFAGEKIDGSWNRIKQAAISMAPTPIPVAGLNSARAGQAQRQLTASVGIKTEPAPTKIQEVANAHRNWMANNPDPKVQADYKRHEASTFPASAYKDLDAALRTKDDKAAELDALETLRSNHPDKAIFQRMLPNTKEGNPKPLFHESTALEGKFRRTLTPEQKAQYEAAVTARREDFQRFLKLWQARKAK